MKYYRIRRIRDEESDEEKARRFLGNTARNAYEKEIKEYGESEFSPDDIINESGVETLDDIKYAVFYGNRKKAERIARELDDDNILDIYDNMDKDNMLVIYQDGSYDCFQIIDDEAIWIEYW